MTELPRTAHLVWACLGLLRDGLLHRSRTQSIRGPVKGKRIEEGNKSGLYIGNQRLEGLEIHLVRELGVPHSVDHTRASKWIRHVVSYSY